MTIPEFEELLNRYLQGQCSEAEIAMLRYWYYTYEMKDLPELTEEQISQVTAMQPPVLPAAMPVVKVRRLRWAWAAAACLLLLTGTALLLLLPHLKHPQMEQATLQIVPGGNKARLTLANGKTIVLDSAGTGALARQGNISIIKASNGLLQYQVTGAASAGDDNIINTISTPAGGQYQLVLADGTRVWLNASSAISFPAAFKTGIREVALKGEAYFEVAHDAARPFIITSGGQQTEILGTHFNINDYQDNGHIITTLLEGKIRISQKQQHVTLTPGQQAIVQDGQDIVVKENVNTAMAVAWKNGLFKFNNTRLKEVMLQLGRWYDVDVRYEGQITERRFSGEITRNASIAEVLDMLKLLKINFTITNNGARKVITVTPDT
ncbi:MAG TPA: FecR domain-containing protein [Chitinophaga sp.]|uniref:FecR family protein n=1 Tax=Chitinophaga sp. TaxID=1869181 RepID=UPI002DBFF208|nr:FecR domain-containing protein [Chitinophaga sp.]HEU4551383.1 FecR domain-containing protein [Chitinophaga sp.]